MLTESRADEKVIYKKEPAIVAAACQAAIMKLGKVTQFSKETGTIAGKISVNILANPVFVNLRISRHAEGTELHIQTQRKEGLFTGGGAQKGLAAFLAALGSDSRLAKASTGGW